MPKNKKTAMRLHTTDLVLELTRRCNMHCADCLRGESEALDMPKQLIDNVFSDCAEISTLTFTGGEPSLVPELIRYALTCAKRHHTSVREVYVATNGKTVPDAFLSALRDWHVKCLADEAPGEPYVDADGSRRIIDANNADEPIGVHVDLSMDYYHDDVPRENVLKLCTLPHVHANKYHAATDDKWVLHTGRAYWNGIGDTPVDQDRPWAYDERSTELSLGMDAAGDARYDGLLYVNVQGQVLKYCDYSYEDQEDHVCGAIDPVQRDRGWVRRLYEEHIDDEE